MSHDTHDFATRFDRVPARTEEHLGLLDPAFDDGLDELTAAFADLRDLRNHP